MFNIQECWKKRHSFCNFHGVYSLLCYCSINFLSCSMIDALASELLETEPSNNNISPGPCSPLEISLSSLPALPPSYSISSADFFSFCDWCQNMHLYNFYWFFLRVPVPLSHLFSARQPHTGLISVFVTGAALRQSLPFPAHCGAQACRPCQSQRQSKASKAVKPKL